MIDPSSVVAWVMLTGLVIAAPAAALAGVPSRLDGAPGAWLAVSGVGNLAGLMFAYRALRVGQVALVAPIISTEGAIAALIAVAAGETIAAAVIASLAVVAFGVYLAAAPAGHRDESRQSRLVAVRFAILAAVAFGMTLYATGRAGSELPLAWILLSGRLVAAVALALPLALSGRLRITAPAIPLVITAGICEVVGYSAYTLGARHGIAVAAVLASQFAPLAALAGFFVFKERLARVQLAGMVLIIAGVAALSGFQS
jgi:drug/metabolite transporter (DMT)-like permease